MINDLWYKNAIIYCLSVGAYGDWYIWSDRKPANAGKGMVFPGLRSRPGFTIRKRRLGLP